MRLINTTSLRISEFYGDKIPPYAILSHTWGDDELTYQQWGSLTWPLANHDAVQERGRKLQEPATRVGIGPERSLSLDSALRNPQAGHASQPINTYSRTILASPNENQGPDTERIRGSGGCRKILDAARKAASESLEWLWVDTVCIDKDKSAELSEAINSMFDWYRDSMICYAVLSDVPSMQEDDQNFGSTIRSSRWFTRGWTLQELLAPSQVVFYSQDWTRLGDKSVGRFADLISAITGIDKACLNSEMDLAEVSIARKMSWLSRRKTTRLEDMAYCVLGVFDVSIPLIYGEGKRAFARLQEEIVRSYHDHTIFCWTWDDDVVPTNWVSMLAPWPSVFKDTGEYVARDEWSTGTPYTMTNLGLSIKLRLVDNRMGFFALLDANVGDGPVGDVACIPIRAVDRTKKLYIRSAYPAKPVLFPVGSMKHFGLEDMLVQTRPRSLHLPRMPPSSAANGPYLCWWQFNKAKLVDIDGLMFGQVTPDFLQTDPEGRFDNTTGTLTLCNTSDFPQPFGRSFMVRFSLEAVPGLGTSGVYYLFFALGLRGGTDIFVYLVSDAELGYRHRQYTGALSAELSGTILRSTHFPVPLGKLILSGKAFEPLVFDLRHLGFLLQES